MSSSHTCRKSASFRNRANLEPLSRPLQSRIRFFQHLLPAPPYFSLTGDRLCIVGHCAQTEKDTGLPRFAYSTDWVRTPLYTGWDYRCVGSPSKLTDLPTVAILALGPNGSSSPAAFTIRNSETSLTLPIPVIFQRIDGVLLADVSFTESLRPCRCQQRNPGSKTGDTTPWPNPQHPSRSSSSKICNLVSQ